MAIAESLSRSGLRESDDEVEADGGPRELVRLWRGFMTARVTLGLVLLALQAALYVMGQSPDRLLIVVCGVYFAATLATRLAGKPRRLGQTFDPRWLSTIGVDLVAFAVLQYVQGQSGINYTPLLVLPVLLASVLGSMSLAMGTAAGVSLLMLSQAVLLSLRQAADPTPLLAQSALTGAGCFVIAFLASQLAARLASEEQRSRSSQLAVRVQREVNALVIESLSEGILVVDAKGTVWAANPAACALLAHGLPAMPAPFDLALEPRWQELSRLASLGFATNRAQHADVVFSRAGAGAQHAHVRTRMTTTDAGALERLCVIFLQDRRELEARLRTDKLASLGRMSTAVAHEIRNPLAAIVHANALLEEDVAEPKLRRLTQMVRQNAMRLERIVDEVLNISRVQERPDQNRQPTVRLDEAVERICQDWAREPGDGELLRRSLSSANRQVAFDAEHLRRVLINLLENARRHSSARRHAIQVSTSTSPGSRAVLGVWSDGPPMEQSVERHLFEPFFSSESRSTGLGLYICRELCDSHGATIRFERNQKPVDARVVDGNEFLVAFEPAPDAAPVAGSAVNILGQA